MHGKRVRQNAKTQIAGLASEFPVKNSSSDNTSRRKRSGGVETNDRFMKVTEVLEDSRNIWLVSHKLDLAGLPPHVRIIDERAPRRTVTVAVSALLDKRLYHRLESAPRRQPRPVDEPVVTGGEAPDEQDSENPDSMGPLTSAHR